LEDPKRSLCVNNKFVLAFTQFRPPEELIMDATPSSISLFKSSNFSGTFQSYRRRQSQLGQNENSPGGNTRRNVTMDNKRLSTLHNLK